jgi:MFS family permease
VSWLNSSTLLASAVGAIVFGRVADILGRKRIYGYEVLILAIGALASAFAPNYTFLLVCRVILGIGIGGDYPVSATIMSEYSGKRDRGKMVGLVFAMQGAGLIFGPLFASVLLWSGLSDGYTTCPTGPARQLSPHRSLPRPRLGVLTGAIGRKVHPILLGHRSGAPSLLDVIV